MMWKKVTELQGRAILGKKMPQRKKSRIIFRYIVFIGVIFRNEGKDENKILGGAKSSF